MRMCNMNWKTQMEAARKGIITPQTEFAAASENKMPQELMQLIAEVRLQYPLTKIIKA